MTNPARLREAVSNLTPMERRVYDAVPIQEPWTISQICTEVMRSGPRVQLNVVGGILNTMKSQHIVAEPTPGHFICIPVPRKLTPVSKPNTTPVPSISQQLGDVAAQLRKAADLLDDAALGVQAQIDSVQAEHEKLKNLKAALAALGELK